MSRELRHNTGRNFFMVYELPERLTTGMCFGNGNPITFLNIDWFSDEGCPVEISRDVIEAEIKKKIYYKPLSSYLVISNNDDFTFIIKGQEEEDK